MDYVWTWSTCKMHIISSNAKEQLIEPTGPYFWASERVTRESPGKTSTTSAVRFADITEMARPNISAFPRMIKSVDGMDRAKVRRADVNGDGLDGMIWVNNINGNGTVLYNRGSETTDGGNRCSNRALQCHDVTAPAGYHVPNSMSRV
ncbi:hypothetical protein VUR80DRAFT_1445 [Thermomyces stellatus]